MYTHANNSMYMHVHVYRCCWCPLLQFSYFDPQKVKSHPEVRTDLFNRDLNKVGACYIESYDYRVTVM